MLSILLIHPIGAFTERPAIELPTLDLLLAREGIVHVVVLLAVDECDSGCGGRLAPRQGQYLADRVPSRRGGV